MNIFVPGPIRFLLAAVYFLFFAWLTATLPAAQPGEAYADFTADGGWCWFSNPRAVSRDGKTCSGWVTGDGTVQAAELDHASGRVTTVNLHEQYQRDDHDNPSFVFLPDGRLMAFYCQHGGGKNPNVIQSRSTARPGDFSEWTPEVALALNEKAGITYSNPHLLSDENNTLYLFWRGGGFKPNMAKSTDGGKIWTAPKIVFSREGIPPGNRPYAQYASNGKDRIHLLFTDGHPRNEDQNSVYYACYRAGAFYRADGTRICGENELPIRPEQADCVYDARKTGVRAWVWDIAFDKNENPIVAYTRLPAEDDHRYHYARWDGKQWQDTELCAGGGWFPQTPSGKTESEPHYSGGLTLDHSDPSVVYLSRPVNGVREIECWVTADGGKSWKSEAVTSNSKFDNIRPVVVRNHASDGPTVLWMNLHGGYVHYTNYRTAIKMDRPARTKIIAPAPLAAAPVPAVDGEPLRIEKPGALKCEGATAAEFHVGAVLFADRKYTVAGCPAALQGMSHLRVPVDGKKNITCTRAGTVWVLTPAPGRNPDPTISQTATLLEQGFKPVELPEFRLFGGDSVTLYQKDCAVGETITFGRWALPLMLGASADAIVAPAPVPAGPPLSGAIEPQAVLTAMERVADWQLANPGKHRPTDWTQGAGYAGIMALAGISNDPKYFDAMLRMAEANQWKLGPSKYMADDHAVGQTYLELWQRRHEGRMIEPMRAQFDEILASPPQFETLDFKQKGINALWSWCDSLFMAPPAWIRLWAATGDKRYLDFAVANWWRTSDYLYDKEEHLYFRDSTYFDRREANGAKIFWGRGNGWVMGALVRMLQYLPQDHPDRARFEAQFKEMAAKILSCQQADGLWRSSLLDPASYPLKETSGSGFYTYALAWGVNQGLLDRATYGPAVQKAWAALVECVAPDGKLTHVQPIGGDPRAFQEDATEVYAVGAFLLAGSEVYRMAVLENTKPIVITINNPANFSRIGETVEIAAPVKASVVMDGSRILDSQVIGDKLLFQVDLAPKETRRYLVLDAGQLAAVPTPAVKTFARFVPERMDDFAWESDRIAHRMYGPALIKKEGTISSGVDVWVKSTRDLILNKWYAAKNYHTDSGEGLDCYSVSHGKIPTRGCGGLGIWDGRRLFVSNNFSSWKVVATGPIRSVFELAYDPWDVGGRNVSEVKRISIDAGSNFSRVESTFTADGKEPLILGVGIARRDGEECVTTDLAGGWLAYWEPEQGKNGNTACGLVFPDGVKKFTKDEANLLAIAQAKPGQPFVYFLGAGWSKSGDFPDSSAWTAYVREFARRLKFPLAISCSKG